MIFPPDMSSCGSKHFSLSGSVEGCTVVSKDEPNHKDTLFKNFRRLFNAPLRWPGSLFAGTCEREEGVQVAAGSVSFSRDPQLLPH